MQAYIVIANTNSVDKFNGLVDFGPLLPILHHDLDEAITHNVEFDYERHYVAKIQFLDEKEIIKGIECAYRSGSKRKFTIKVLETYHVKKVSVL